MTGRLAFAALALLLCQRNAEAAAARDTAACSCTGAIRSNLCYNTIRDAIAASQDGEEIQIGRAQAIVSTVPIAASVTIRGVTCAGRRAFVAAGMSDRSAVFQLTGDQGQSVVLDGFDMSPLDAGRQASALRSEGAAARTLRLEDMNFVGFTQQDVNGTVIYMGNCQDFSVTGGSFVNNRNLEDPVPKQTGGQVYIEEIQGSAQIGGTWKGNRAEALHSLGGAIFLGDVHGPVDVSGTFLDNFATDGGAVHIRRVRNGASVDFSGKFEGNTVKDMGYGCRGAAVRSLLVGNGATATLSGIFKHNSAGAECRGGVFAVNNVQDRGIIVLEGTYEDNDASVGTVLSITMGAWTGTVKIDGGARFKGNIAHEIKDTDILDLRPCGLCQTLKFDTVLSESDYDGEGVSYRGGIAPEHLPEIEDALKWQDWIWHFYGKDAEKKYIRDWGRK